MITSKLSLTLIYFGKTGPEEGRVRGSIDVYPCQRITVFHVPECKEVTRQMGWPCKSIKCIQYYNKIIS